MGFVLQILGEPKENRKLAAEITVQNPLPERLENCCFSIEGANLTGGRVISERYCRTYQLFSSSLLSHRHKSEPATQYKCDLNILAAGSKHNKNQGPFQPPSISCDGNVSSSFEFQTLEMCVIWFYDFMFWSQSRPDV